MIESWLSMEYQGVKSTAEDTRTLALHVLACAGFEQSYPFKSSSKDEAQRPTIYRDSISIILRNVLLIVELPQWAFKIPLLPTKWAQVGWAITEFRQHMMNQLAQEKKSIAEGNPESNTLMSNLVRAFV